MSIALLTFALGLEYRNLMSECVRSKEAYASKHRYEFFDESRFPVEVPSPQIAFSWLKVKWVREFLTNHSFDWVAWFDADTLITNSAIRLEHIIAQANPDTSTYLIFSEDPRDACSCGIWFAARNKWTLDLLDYWYSFAEAFPAPNWEQSAMNRLLHDMPPLMGHIKLLNQRICNSFALETRTRWKWYKWQNGDFLVHFAGIKKEEVPLLLKSRYINRCK